jgi:hypothetical protein
VPASGPAWEHTLATLERLTDLLSVLAPVHDVDAASDLTLALVSVRLGRHRAALGLHLGTPLADERPVRWLLMLAAALSSVADAETVRARLMALRLSSEEVRRVLNSLMARTAFPSDPTLSRRAIYRYFAAHGAAGVEGVFLALAGFLAGFVGAPPADPWNERLDVAAALLRAYFETPAEAVSPPALLTGDELMAALELRPGPQVGALLEAIREAQAAGEVADRAAALDLARARLAGG